jgi:uncharacterized protein YbjQ (UPF0145 family)
MFPSPEEVAHIPVVTTDTYPEYSVVEVVGEYPICCTGPMQGRDKNTLDGYTTLLYMMRGCALERGANAVVGLVVTSFTLENGSNGLMAIGTAVKIVPTEGEV